MNRNLDTTNERTPLITIVQVEMPRQRYQHSARQRFFIAALGSALIWVVFFVLPHRQVRPVPIVDTQTCYSSLNNSRAYASAEALSNNMNDFCQDVANNVPLINVGWTRSKTYYPNTPEEYTMIIVLSSYAFSSDQYQCTDAMSSIINGCDVSIGGSNPMNWKQGGKRVWGQYTYPIDISRQNRP